MAPELKPIDPKSPRWEPAADPNDIVIPGLDTSAPPHDQIEQIEQLITIKLQNIDANFSKIQHVMANRILPAVKKYAVGTQPVREAAKFWTTFYEQAAQIRIPTYDDYTGQEQTQEETETTQTESESGPTEGTESDSESEVATPNPNRTFNADGTSSEVSFAPGQAAFSSTPATVSRTRAKNPHDSFVNQGTEPMPSWSASLESPLLQLNRQIQSLAEDREAAVPSTSATHHNDVYDASQDVTQRPIQPGARGDESSILRSVDKGKARDGSQTLRHDVLRRNANTSTATASTSRTTSPLKFKPKTPVIKSLNPYLPLDSNPAEWKGVVDLKDPSIASPQRPHPPASSIKLATFKPSAAIGLARARNKTPPPSGDDSFDDNFGMSPPVMTEYARLPTLGRTPKKEAAERIMKSLVDVEQRGVFGPVGAAQRAGQPKGSGYGTESSMSSMPTPPSVTRYTRPSYPRNVPSETSGSVVDASLDSIMRRVGLSVPGYSVHQAPPAPAPAPTPVFAPPVSQQPVFSSVSSTSSLGSMRSVASGSVFQPLPPTSALPPQPMPIETPQLQYDFYGNDVVGQGTGEDADDSMDSLDDPDAPPFVFAPSDDSFDDSFDDSMEDDGTGTGEPFIVQGDEADFDDDSFDDMDGEGEEETVFGVPPAHRLQQQAQGQFRVFGEDLLQDTIGIGAQMQVAGRVEESPTPWNANARG